ncbi:MAG: tRNA uridine-5-carboxymethylaminomethyl(34) synthesis GTPase MnmE [Prevotella sp.]|nr:tRNA uridine-5-carboxymethylaminomethyl(34) synthesis GTPase MnmE [Prevotella sp.]
MNDTICALATAPGGALGTIRISGPQALEILSHVFRGSGDVLTYAANTIHYGYIVEYDSMSHHPLPIDEVMVSVFKTPHSFTGEDSVEISCHGSRYILNKVLELLVRNGCRMANPGEFTQRAYLNGKMDLSQAEAVADLIASSNKATHQMAMSQLRGHFSNELSHLREQLLKLTTLLELELDFSDHEDLEFADRSELLELAEKTDAHILKLVHSFETGQALKQGIPVAIVGKTNVGKSTLLNRLVKDDRALVSDIHGTTRDTIEEAMEIQGVSFRFIDTAGIRQTSDTVEKMGIERTYQMIDKARIILWLIDEAPKPDELHDMQERCKDKSLIIIQNKIDKEEADLNYSLFTNHYSLIKISAKKSIGLDTLEAAIYEAADIPTLSESDVIVSSTRHYHALLSAHKNLAQVIEGLHQNISGDLLSENLRLVLSDLGEITGDGLISSQEVLNNIFSHFCVGK